MRQLLYIITETIKLLFIS